MYGLTVLGRRPCEEPVDVNLVAGYETCTEALADELQELGLEAVSIGVMREASRSQAPREGRRREPQPFCNHGVDSVASDQYLQTQCVVTSILSPFKSHASREVG